MNQELYKYELKDIKHVEYLENLCHEIGVRFKTEEVYENSNISTFFQTPKIIHTLESNDKNRIDYVLFEYNKYIASYNYAKTLEGECILKKDNKSNDSLDAILTGSTLNSTMRNELTKNGWVTVELSNCDRKKGDKIKLRQIIKHWIEGFNL